MTLIYSSGKIRIPTASDIWRRAVLAALRTITDRLNSGAYTAPDDVHALRRGAKQVRALALLAPPALSVLSHDTRQHADTLRRSLGGARDAQVRRQTFRVLREHADATADGVVSLLEAPDGDGETAQTMPAHLADAFATLTHDWANADVTNIDAAELADSLAATYRRARKRVTKAKGAIADLHRWRRAIVDLDLQLQPFATGAPKIARMAKRASKLRDLLGKVNDVSALMTFLERMSDGHALALDALRPPAAAEVKRLGRKIKTIEKDAFKHAPQPWRDVVMSHLPGAPAPPNDATDAAATDPPP